MHTLIGSLDVAVGTYPPEQPTLPAMQVVLPRTRSANRANAAMLFMAVTSGPEGSIARACGLAC
jgi:hypothetical protein